MRNKEDLKTVRKTVLMTEATAADIDNEAERRGIKANAVIITSATKYRYLILA